MFGFLTRWYRRRRRKSILKDIKKAKELYEYGVTISMCHSFLWVDIDKYDNYDKMRKRIPEFKPETFNVDPKLLNGFWWRESDRDSRIKAFNKLIEIYSK
jgi:hypothetical protein